jgi:hypothetical protein
MLKKNLSTRYIKNLLTTDPIHTNSSSSLTSSSSSITTSIETRSNDTPPPLSLGYLSSYQKDAYHLYDSDDSDTSGYHYHSEEEDLIWSNSHITTKSDDSLPVIADLSLPPLLPLSLSDPSSSASNLASPKKVIELKSSNNTSASSFPDYAHNDSDEYSSGSGDEDDSTWLNSPRHTKSTSSALRSCPTMYSSSSLSSLISSSKYDDIDDTNSKKLQTSPSRK